MLIKTGLFFYVFFNPVFATSEDDTVVISLKPEEVISTFRSVFMSGFIKELADVFATKAAEQFLRGVKRIKTEEKTKKSPKQITPLKQLKQLQELKQLQSLKPFKKVKTKK